MNYCKLFALLMLHVVIHLAECQPPRIGFSRLGSDLNTIRFTCTTSGGSPINNAFFRRYDDVLNNQAAENCEHQLSPESEGDFTCTQGSGGVRSEVLQLGAKPTPPAINDKVMYVQLGSVAEIPCDFQPGILSELYSIEWGRTHPTFITVTPENLPSPHRMISLNNFALFIDIEELTQDQQRYQCTVFVDSCSGACTASSFIESGAEVTLRVVEPPEITGVRGLVETAGEIAEFTCNVTGEITSIYWMVDGIEHRDCNRDPRFCVTIDNGNSSLAVDTTSLIRDEEITVIDIVCVVVQEFEDENIINPDTQELGDTIQFTYSGEAKLTIQPEGTTPEPVPTPDSQGTSSNFELDTFHYIIGVVVLLVVLLAIVVVIGIAAVVSYKMYKTRRITRGKTTAGLVQRIKECEQNQVDLAKITNPTPQVQQTLEDLQETKKTLQKEYQRRLVTDTAEEGNEDNTKPEAPDRDEDNTMPEAPDRDEDNTKPEAHDRDEDNTMPEAPDRDEDNTIPEAHDRDEDNTRPECIIVMGEDQPDGDENISDTTNELRAVPGITKMISTTSTNSSASSTTPLLSQLSREEQPPKAAPGYAKSQSTGSNSSTEQSLSPITESTESTHL